MSSVEARNGRNTLDAKSAERDPEHASGAGQDGRDTHDVEQVQSRKSRGKSWCSGHTIVRVDHY